MKLNLLFLLSVIIVLKAYSQTVEIDENLLVGLNYGQASQNKFPFNNPNYLYHNQSFKIQFNFLLSKKKKLSYELNIEPGLYLCEHQLLNKWFIQPDNYPDYLILRERFTKKRTFNEYALNIGIIVRYEILSKLSSYMLGSTGPMFSDQDTERLYKGFAFSNIFGFGFSYQEKKLKYDIRLSLRHNSNANLSEPNHGHNSAGIEFGVSFQRE